MREKTKKTVVAFAANADAAAVEAKAAEIGFPGRMIPLPSEISAGCGLAWCCEDDERQAVLNALSIFSLAHEGVYEVELY